MLRRIITAMLAVALACTAGAASALAHTPADAGSDVRREPASGEKLKEDFSRLVADAKAGKVGTAFQPRQQPAQSHGLSKGTKITIAVVVVAVVITAVVIASKANNGPGGPGIGIF